MGFIADIELTRITLFVMFVVPFSYYALHRQFWYHPERIRLCDFILTCLSILLALFCAVRVYYAVIDKDSAQIQFALLHICPLVLTLLAIARGKGLSDITVASPTTGAPAESGGYAPRARNDEVEEVSWDSLIIDQKTKDELISVINLLRTPAAAKQYGIALPKGILFNGPPGTGKTTIAKAVANEAELSFFVLRANDIVSKWVGESEKNLTKLFEAAQAEAPSVIFIDEIDSLGKKRSGASAGPGDNLLNHLLQLIDGVLKNEGVYIIGATNRADLVDEALRRAGRLNRVIDIPLPDDQARRKLFQLYMSKLKVASDVDVDALVEATKGNSGADIKAICNQAGLHAFQREQALPVKERRHLVISEDIESALALFLVDEDDIENDTKKSSEPQPLNDQVEKIGWGDLIVDDSLKQELQSVITLLKDPDTATKYGISVPKGILLNGPPGTGKTTLAKVIANEASLSFFVLRVDEVISKWVGESEKNLTKLFKAAAKHAPSVIFIDEVDSIGKNRAEGNAQHADNLLNHLLQLIDGVIKREGIYVIAATNRGDLVDPALKRGGRLNRVIEVPLPGEGARKQIFELYLRKLPLAQGINTQQLAKLTHGKSAADIREICNQAGLNAFKRESQSGSREYQITVHDLDQAVRTWLGTDIPVH